jgi:hypothetical protein
VFCTFGAKFSAHMLPGVGRNLVREYRFDYEVNFEMKYDSNLNLKEILK